MFANLIFAAIRIRARRGLVAPLAGELPKERARRTGIRGETYAYWYLRRQGYTMIARNFRVPYLKGEIDLVGYDGSILAFIEVKTRDSSAEESRRPEDAVDWRKRKHLVRMAGAFMRAYRIDRGAASTRFDIVAIEARPASSPVVRLLKGAFVPRRR
ncbi:MAG TPA: YraN family protein [Candidatus Acidoferrum sp.]|nr:YraN family protein [Candidatus Acidoferrum sp.]